MLGRDGTTILNDPNEFGQEWQVRTDEPKLFQNSERSPQYPQQCVLPDVKSVGRRLGHSVALKAAEEACAHWTKNKKECIFDVMATGDLEVALACSLF